VRRMYDGHEGMGRPLGREAYGSARSRTVRRQHGSDVVMCLVE
jgi:hypothetical protein